MYSYKKYRKAKAKIITKTTTTLMTHLFICSSFFHFVPSAFAATLSSLQQQQQQGQVTAVGDDGIFVDVDG